MFTRPVTDCAPAETTDPPDAIWSTPPDATWIDPPVEISAVPLVVTCKTLPSCKMRTGTL
jgi:hypothetical protein